MRNKEYSREDYDNEEVRRQNEAHLSAQYPKLKDLYAGLPPLSFLDFEKFLQRRKKLEDTVVQPALERLRSRSQQVAEKLNKEYDELNHRLVEAAQALEAFKRDKLGMREQDDQKKKKAA